MVYIHYIYVYLWFGPTLFIVYGNFIVYPTLV